MLAFGCGFCLVVLDWVAKTNILIYVSDKYTIDRHLCKQAKKGKKCQKFWVTHINVLLFNHEKLK